MDSSLKCNRLIISVVYCLAFLCSKGQKNLILNGSFEDTLYCLTGSAANIQQFKYWYNPTANSSFAYGKCVYYIPTVPRPRTGWCSVSAYSYLSGSNDGFNYIAGKFASPLVVGREYCFSMYVKLYPYQKGSNNLAFFTDTHAIFYNTGSLVPATPVLTIPFTVIDTNWVQFNGTFIATGGETDFMIGGHMPYALANYPIVYPNISFDASHFVYDDFSLIEIDSITLGNDMTICSQSDTLLLGDSAWAETKYKWYKNGNLIDSIHTQIKVKPIVTSTYVLVQENCNISSDTIVINVVDDCSALIDGLHVSNVFTPNGDDVNDTFKVSIETGTITQGSIYNRWGNLVFQSSISTMHYFIWDGHSTSGEACHAGTYFYVISYINSQNELKTVKGFVSLFR